LQSERYGQSLPKRQDRGKTKLLAAVVVLALAFAALPGMASAGSLSSAHITSPLGATLGSPEQTFTWSKGTGVSAYYLYIGTHAGASDVFNSGQLSTTSVTATDMPANGSKLYVRLWSWVGNHWEYNDYTYAAAQPQIAELTSPEQHAFLDSTSPTFTWTAGTGVIQYYLYVGSTPGAADYFNSGAVPSGTTSVESSGLPDDGSTVYVRLWSYVPGLGWLFHDYQMTAMGAIAPTIAGGVGVCTPLINLSALVVTPPTANADEYLLDLGTGGPGSSNVSVISATSIGDLLVDLSLSPTLPITCPAPGDSVTVYARLNYRFGAVWYHTDATLILTTPLPV
jgi:hypothetical protein